MKYISTRNTKENFTFKEVFLRGLAPDGGLYIPKKFPIYSKNTLQDLKNLTYEEIATKIIFDFCSDDFKESEIEQIVKKLPCPINQKNLKGNIKVNLKGSYPTFRDATLRQNQVRQGIG